MKILWSLLRMSMPRSQDEMIGKSGLGSNTRMAPSPSRVGGVRSFEIKRTRYSKLIFASAQRFRLAALPPCANVWIGIVS